MIKVLSLAKTQVYSKRLHDFMQNCDSFNHQTLFYCRKSFIRKINYNILFHQKLTLFIIFNTYLYQFFAIHTFLYEAGVCITGRL